tara:strand:- start:127 stop:567 length:441 start_codon:yes stop_codon:yes gene_type:complete
MSILHYSEYKINEPVKKTIKRNKTYKKRSDKVNNFLNAMENEESLVDFTPPKDDKPPKNYNDLPINASAQEYYKQHTIPYNAEPRKNKYYMKDALMEKLNYMIHLLEAQKNEKTENVTEELVLYLFLGVFVIYIVDSFARVGKYIR